MRKVIIPPLLLVLLLFVLVLPVSAEQDHPVLPTPMSNKGFSSVVTLDAAETPLVTFTVGINTYYTSYLARQYNGNTGGATMDAVPFIFGGRTFVPVRYLAEALGANVSWDASSQKITISYPLVVTEVLVIGSTTLMTGGVPSEMDVAPMIVNGRAYLPASYVADGLGCLVLWFPASQSITIYSKAALTAAGFTQSDYNLLFSGTSYAVY